MTPAEREAWELVERDFHEAVQAGLDEQPAERDTTDTEEAA